MGRVDRLDGEILVVALVTPSAPVLLVGAFGLWGSVALGALVMVAARGIP